MEHQNIIFTNDLNNALNDILSNKTYNRLFVITDSNTRQMVLPKLAQNSHIANAVIVEFAAGDVNKNTDSLISVWQQIGEGGGTRHSLAINLGGGVVTDLGAFAASTFKRGIPFINIPTTLLSAVDAAIGGKTGINFNGLKNEIGVFNEATDVVISTAFLSTLPQTEINSGYAEMLKHGLLKSRETFMQLLNFDISHCTDMEQLLVLLKESVEVKAEIVRQDPHEHGLRRALNLGHTVGHAFESMAMMRNKPIPHGYAVAYGLVVDAVLSHILCQFSSADVHLIADYVHTHYGSFYITCDDYPQLLNLMKHDKKSRQGEINCTLLGAPGDIRIDCIINDDTMKEAFDIYRDLMHI
ncbi:MAG: 3-dehydroquinate synthase [Muribaculaceae bacterium]